MNLRHTMRALVSASLVTVASGLAFSPSDRRNHMWDTWLYRSGNGWLLNYLVLDDTAVLPPGTSNGVWNGVSTASSVDGVHWADFGVSIRKDCIDKDDCAGWLGSGSVWKKTDAGSGGELYVMNYSQEYDCEGSNCQTIFFATSSDLINWTPLAPDAKTKGGLVFRVPANSTDYRKGGRWDCITVLPRPAGGYYGYWTASPSPSHSSPAYCGGGACGAGFGVSDDGLHWRALPTPGPAVAGEVGGVALVGERTFMTFDGGHLYEAPSPSGPFVPSAKNHAFLTQEGRLFFARLWGSPYTQEAGLVLITHQQVNRGFSARNTGSIYAGLVKRAVLDPTDGVLRAQWWSQNDALRGSALAVRAVTVDSGIPLAPSGALLTTTACVGVCLTSGLWLEGSIAPSNESTIAGIWLQLDQHNGFIMAIATGAIDSNTDARPAGATYHAAASAGGGAQPFILGATDAAGNWSQTPLQIDRSMETRSASPSSWRLVARNAWSGEAMAEFYVDDVLALPFTLPGGLTGAFAAVGGLTIRAAHRLTLPTQLPMHQ